MTRDELCEVFGFEKHKKRLLYPDRKHPRRKHYIKTEQYDKKTTIYDNLVKLQKRRLVEKFSRSNGKRGRSYVYWKINGNI